MPSISPASAASLRVRCNAEEARRLVQVEPRLVAIRRRPEDRDLVMRSVCGDPLPSPAIAMLGHQAVAIENAGDQIIAGDQHQLPDGRDDIARGAVALSAPALRQAQLGIGAANPMDSARSWRLYRRYRRPSPE